MKRLLLELRQALVSGEAAVLVTIVARNGSTSRGVGTAMVVLSDGTMIGTIGGGSMEYRARKHAMELSEHSPDATVPYEIHSDHLGLEGIASGTVTLLFRRFCGEPAQELLDEALQAIENDDRAFLICSIKNETAGNTCLVSSKRLAGQFHLDHLPEAPVSWEAETSWFVEPLANEPRVLVFGGGHVAQKTAAQLAFLDYRVWIIEGRAEFADPALFPTAERILCASLDDAKKTLAIYSRDHAMVMTSAHESDYEILRWLLTTPVDYIGCIGSRQKIARTKERLLLDGVNPAQIERVHAPIGLNIGAETPAEIAVSIAAELIAYCKNQDPV